MMKKLLFSFILLSIVTIAGGAILLITKNHNTDVTDSERKSETSTNGNAVNDQEKKQGKVIPKADLSTFENGSLKILLHKGWQVENVPDTKDAIFIKRDNYIFYINPNFNQSGGVWGARLSEISTDTPGVKLVVKEHPYSGCSDKEESSTFYQNYNGWTQFNEYISPDSDPEICNIPTDNQVHWYLSYYVRADNQRQDFEENTLGYVTYLDPEHEESGSIVVTLSVESSNIDDLPVKDSSELKQVFDEVGTMLKTLEVKHR